MFWKIVGPYVIAAIAALVLGLAILITWNIGQSNDAKEDQAIYSRAYADASRTLRAEFGQELAEHNQEIERLLAEYTEKQAASDARLAAANNRLRVRTDELLDRLETQYADEGVADSTLEVLRESATRWPERQPSQ